MVNMIFAMASQVNENAKRIAYSFLMIFILIFAIISVIGSAIIYVTKKQGGLIDRKIYDPLKHGVITDQKHFMRYATKKNLLIFFEEASIPFLIILVGTLVYIMYCAIGEHWGYNPWSIENGFGSLFFTWDFSTVFTLNPEYGAGLLINWPKLTHSPEFNWNYWCGYISCICFIVGGVWYFFTVQGLIGRAFRILHLKRTSFEKSLEGFNVNDNLENLKK